MGKITVKAKEDFFDGANHIQRTKDAEFILKSEYAKDLEEQGLVTIPKEKAEPKPVAKKKIAKPTTKAKRK